MVKLTHTDCVDLACMLRDKINASPSANLFRVLNIYGIPRGGVPVAYLVSSMCGHLRVVDDPEKADFFVDDLIDSGATRDRYNEKFPRKPFFVLINKQTDPEYKGKWIVFPWEDSEEKSAEDIATRLLQYIGEDTEREGLQETPVRFLKAWKEWTSGYGEDPASVFKCFEDGAEKYDELIVCSPIPFFSHCEHHLAAIFGTVHIGYIPSGRIVGLSKFGRLVDIFAKRLQVQERLTTQIAGAIEEHLKPKGVAVIVKARHFCMESRGVNKPGVETTTSAMRGVFRDEVALRNEFMGIIK